MTKHWQPYIVYSLELITLLAIMVVIRAMIVPYQATRGYGNEISNLAMSNQHDLSITSTHFIYLNYTTFLSCSSPL